MNERALSLADERMYAQKSAGRASDSQTQSVLLQLLTEPEQVLFRRLAVFFGGFDLDAAHAVAAAADMERYQVLDQLMLLVDKSLVVAEDSPRGTRYRLLETVRQYAQEKLHESREGDEVRARHRDHTRRWPPCWTPRQTAPTTSASSGRTPK